MCNSTVAWVLPLSRAPILLPTTLVGDRHPPSPGQSNPFPAESLLQAVPTPYVISRLIGPGLESKTCVGPVPLEASSNYHCAIGWGCWYGIAGNTSGPSSV